MRLRKRAFGLLFGAGLLFFLATNVQAGWLFVLAAMLFGAVIAGVVLPATATRGLVIERRAPGEVHQGSPVLVDITVHGGRRTTRRGLIVRDGFLDAADLWVATVRAGERVEVSSLRQAASSRPARAGSGHGSVGCAVRGGRTPAPGHGDRRRHARRARDRAARGAAVRASGIDHRDRDAHRPSSRPRSRVPRHPRVPPRRQHAARALGLDRARRHDDGARARAGADPAPRHHRRRLARR